MSFFIENASATKFFNSLLRDRVSTPTKVILVTHLLEDKNSFIETLNEVHPIYCIIPKPNSINQITVDFVKKLGIPIEHVKRDELTKEGAALRALQKYLEQDEVPFVILDVGGYFSASLVSLHQRYPERFIGVVEDTENGHQKYQSALDKYPSPVPIFSVARSVLKEPEDYLVGESIVFSAEVLMREINSIMTGKKAIVLGYGKIGESIADNLRRKNVQVSVYDTDPQKRLKAYSRGFTIPERNDALRSSDMIFCATGSYSISDTDLDTIKDGSFIFSATSSEDEFSINPQKHKYDIKKVSEYMYLYHHEFTSSGKIRSLYFGNNGNAVNFIHGAKVGEFIHLVQGEIIFSAKKLMKEYLGKSERVYKNIFSLNELEKKKIANFWLTNFI